MNIDLTRFCIGKKKTICAVEEGKKWKRGGDEVEERWRRGGGEETEKNKREDFASQQFSL